MSGAPSNKTTKKAKTKRTLAPPKYKSFRLSKRIKHASVVYGKLPSSWQLLKDTFKMMFKQWRFFVGVSFVYGLFLFLVVRGIGGGVNVPETREQLSEILSLNNGDFYATLASFGILVGSSAVSNDEVISLYQTVVLVIVSLAVIWGIRQAQSESKLRVKLRDAFYKGMTPLVPFLLVLVVVGLQFSLVVLAGSIYSIISFNGLATTGIEQALWLAIVTFIILLTVYLLSSSILALYIVTLPDMTPMKALRAARKLVEYRRWVVMRKIISLPILMLVVVAVIVVPLIATIPRVAEPVFVVLTVGILPVFHGYMYNLYRSLL